MSVAYLGLGGNIGDAAGNIQRAVSLLSEVDSIVVIGASHIYRTKPVGDISHQPDFLNAVVAVDTTLDPIGLLGTCLSIEQKLGRVRTERWGPRTIDIDILLFDALIVDEPGLVIPHGMLRNRLFALVPLADVAPANLELPHDGRQLVDVLTSAFDDPAFSDQKPLLAIDTGIKFSVLQPKKQTVENI